MTASTAAPTLSLSRGYVICLCATIFWSFTGILIGYLSTAFGMPSLVLAFWRDLIFSLGLALAFLSSNRALFRLERRYWLFMVFYGLLVAAFNTMWTFSVALNGAAVATVLAYSSPAMTAILGRWLFFEDITPVKIIAIVISIFGTLFVSGAHDPAVWQVNTLGIITGLLTGLGFTGYSLMGKSAAQKSINSWTALLYSFSLATVLIFLLNVVSSAMSAQPLLPNLLWLGNSLVGWAILIVLALGPSIGGFGLYSLSLNYLPPTVANLIATLEPALTAVMAYLLLNERLTAIQFLGSALILVSVVILRLGEFRQSRASRI